MNEIRIEQFKKMGLGLFVHFGLYSQMGKGEWFYSVMHEEGMDPDGYRSLMKSFKINNNWAKQIVKTAKKAGFKYINITARHHDGFSLYDTCGLSDYDAPHSVCHRDLIKEFVDECNKEGIVPFFYHTLLDWHHPDYQNNFPKYIDYLIKSIEILCKNYGKIGGFWFDGYWDKPNENWQFDRLYSTIRKYQPDAIIINNTGLSALGEVSHYEIDAVTFERGNPFNVSNNDGKDRTGEVCDSLTDHWGYAKNDICIKSIPYLIDELIDCRKHQVNLLLNVGPLKNGLLRGIEKETLLEFGRWVKTNNHLIFNTLISNLEADNALIFEDDKYYYAVIKDVPMSSNENVARKQSRPNVTIHTNKRIVDATYMDDKKQKVVVDNKTKSFPILPFRYGTSLHTRVVRFKLK